MVDYVLPDEYPYKDEGTSGSEPLVSADYNPLLAAVADLAAAGGRVATLEANPLVAVDTTAAAVGQLVAVAQASPLEFELVDTTEITPAEIGAQPADADLTTIAALTPSNDDVLQCKSGAWTNRTVAQVKTDLGVAADIAAAAPTTIYLPASALGSMGGAPGIATAGGGGFVECWLLDQTTNETIGTTVRIPSGWATYGIKVHGCNLASGTGDVVLRATVGARAVGDNLATGFTPGAEIATTAGALGIMQEVALASALAADPTKDTAISISRRAAAVADTLANDYCITAVILTKAS